MGVKLTKFAAREAGRPRFRHHHRWYRAPGPPLPLLGALTWTGALGSAHPAHLPLERGPTSTGPAVQAATPPMTSSPPRITPATVEARLQEIFIAAEGTALRKEDRKKSVEVAALLGEVARAGRRRLLVDAAAGKAYVGLLAAELLEAREVVLIERDASRVSACESAIPKLAGRPAVSVRQGDVGDHALWPADPDVVTALHACGEASDRVLDAAVRAQARWLFLVPCCYAGAVPFSATAEARLDALGVPRHAEVRRRLVMGLIDAERTLRLEAAGYETTVVPFVAPTVTPHNLLWRARRAGEARRMAEAAERLAALRADALPPRTPC
ncbi:methyltransferase [Chondromyces crocatus]|uniref:Methyltransferase domain-containing protein n=1 Tax=Chondromyces crocatus TaxID=52 RepID=A0A0K1EAS4_CHOCO|nr:methyltransferase [Chondromyces crocatus]AKT37663.1 uncharacterized protein CMC5_018050 [Chondromyces crocatus]